MDLTKLRIEDFEHIEHDIPEHQLVELEKCDQAFMIDWNKNTKRTHKLCEVVVEMASMTMNHEVAYQSWKHWSWLLGGLLALSTSGLLGAIWWIMKLLARVSP